MELQRRYVAVRVAGAVGYHVGRACQIGNVLHLERVRDTGAVRLGSQIHGGVRSVQFGSQNAHLGNDFVVVHVLGRSPVDRFAETHRQMLCATQLDLHDRRRLGVFSVKCVRNRRAAGNHVRRIRPIANATHVQRVGVAILLLVRGQVHNPTILIQNGRVNTETRLDRVVRGVLCAGLLNRFAEHHIHLLGQRSHHCSDGRCRRVLGSPADFLGVVAFVASRVVGCHREKVGFRLVQIPNGVARHVAHVESDRVVAGTGTVVDFVALQIGLRVGIPGQGDRSSHRGQSKCSKANRKDQPER